MKINVKHLSWVLFFFVTANSFASSLENQHAIAFFELQGEFLGNLKYAGNGTNLNQYGFGGSLNAGRECFSFILEYNYRNVDLSNLNLPNLKNVSIHEFYIGLRYYPMRPTLVVGNIAVRVTAGAMGGLDLEPNYRLLLFGGLAISPFSSISGLTINFVYRPGTLPAGVSVESGGYKLKPCWMIRIGLLLGPSL
jgi:hypothetical protein